MKKNISVFLLLFFVLAAPVSAQDSSQSAQVATPSATKAAIVEKKAQDLLDRVATKVAELAKSNSRTFHGNVKSKGTNNYILSTPEGNITVTTNDATDFYRIKASKKSETDFAGIKVGEDLVAMGAVDPGGKSLTASQVITKIKRTLFVGPIEQVNGTTLTIKGNKIDIADASYQKMDKDGKITVATAKDFESGKTAFVVAHSPEDNVYSSLKALVLED